MLFEEVLPMLKAGARIRRASWPLVEHVFKVGGSRFAVSRPPLSAMYAIGTEIKYRPHVDKCLLDGSIGVYTFSNEDVFAEDWAYAFGDDDYSQLPHSC